MPRLKRKNANQNLSADRQRKRKQSSAESTYVSLNEFSNSNDSSDLVETSTSPTQITTSSGTNESTVPVPSTSVSLTRGASITTVPSNTNCSSDLVETSTSPTQITTSSGTNKRAISHSETIEEERAICVKVPKITDPDLMSTNTFSEPMISTGMDTDDPEKLLTEQLEKEIQLQASKVRKRKIVTENEHEIRRMKDKERKRQKRLHRTEAMVLQQKERNKLEQQKRRSQMSEEKKLQERELNKEQHQQRRSEMNEKDKSDQRELNKKQHQQRRSEMNEKDKSDLRECDKEQHQRRRSQMNEKDKSDLRECDKKQHQRRRSQMNEKDKSDLRECDKEQHQRRRSEMNEKDKSDLRECDKEQHQRRRSQMNEKDKSDLRECDKKQHQRRRSQMNEKDKSDLRECDKEQHQRRRIEMNEKDKSDLRECDKEQHQRRRSQMNEKDKSDLRECDKKQHQRRRSQMNEKDKSDLRECDKEQHQRRRSQMNEKDKSDLRECDKKQHQRRRSQMNEKDKSDLRECDKEQHQRRRSQMNEKDKSDLRELNKKQQQQKRSEMTIEDKMTLRQLNKEKQRDTRSQMTETEKSKLQEKNSSQKRNRRQDKSRQLNDLYASYQQDPCTTHDAVQEVVQTFLRVIQGGPTFPCCICYRMLYRHSVKCFTDKHKQKVTDLVTDFEFQEIEMDWICQTCSSALLRNKIPAQALFNNLKGSQHGLKGQVVLVPSNVQSTANSLPRDTRNAQVVALNLKRRLSDKHTFCKEYIRPQIVNEAFQVLKSINKHYEHIQLNENWTDISREHDEELWTKTCTNTEPDILTDDGLNDSGEESPEVTDSEDEVEKDIDVEVAEDLSLKRSLNNITCLYPEKGPLVRSNKVLNLAPAEGQRPTSVFYQDYWETLAFPSLFPDGINTFHEERKTPITPKKYVNSRLLSKDFRFAENAEYIFQCLHWVESVAVNDGITFAMKKARQDDLSVFALQNPENLLKMFKDDEIMASFKRIRGTPQYWKEMQQDMLAKIRYFGPYTFFISCSAADFHWPELIQIIARQYGEFYDIKYIEEEMDKKTKRTWLARNPVTVARHIDFIFRKLWGNVILSGLHPVGQILNYDIRKEMQSRGTAHFHSAVHVKDAPIVNKNTDDEVVSFIDKHISCIVPDEEDDETLRSLVLSRQVHHHTRTCKKKTSLECRFHFPKPPANATLVSRVPCEENAKQTIKSARDLILKVMNTLQEMGTNHTLSEILNQSEVSQKEYEDALKISMKKTNIILKREASDIFVNPYNPVILKCIRANMDIQYITDVWACVAYITSYMCKPEKTMSELMRNACKEAPTVKDKLKSIGNVFLKSREVSQHEAIARLVQMPLKESNTPVMFVPTGFKHQRTRLLKPRSILERMEDDDTDVFLPNIIDKYCARPSKLENMCLAEFSSSYSRTYSQETEQPEGDEFEDEVNINKTSREKIILKDNLGTLVKRKTPLVLRDYFVSKDRDSEKYYHRLLLLYFPWREEDELESCGSYEDKFNSVQSQISDTVQKYEPYLDEVVEANEAADGIEDGDEEIWDTLAPQAEQIRDDEDGIGETNRILDIENLTEEQLDFDQHNQLEQVPRTSCHSLTSNITIESDSRHTAMVRSLNARQKSIHDYVFSWCRHMTLATSISEQPPPFHIFLSGGAGVGKSHTVHTIFQSAIRALKQPGAATDLPTVILTAPTGKAAVNIGGTTLHNAFRLPVKKRGSYETRHHSNNSLNSMRSMYSQLKILVIDEISMVGATTLSNLNITMQEIFENEAAFGGIAVLVVGDLLQLNPVGEKPVYKECKLGYGALATSVWELFQLYELTDIVRQKDDPTFAELLSRVRIGQHKEDDIRKLKKLERNEEIPTNALSIFLTNELKDMYNKTQLESLTGTIHTITAIDSKKDLNTNRVAVSITSANLHETGGLAGEIQFAENAKYMQTKNIDIQDGLVNGATGTIVKLDIPAEKPLNGTIYVKFDDSKIGKQAKLKSKYKGLVPIKAITAGFSITERSKSIQVERTQFPGTLAWGITVHKSRGSTFEQMIGDMTTQTGKNNTMPGQIYTMLSRAKSMKGLKLCAFDSKKIKVNETALQEMERLKKSCLLQTVTLHHALQPPESSFCILYLNIRSLKEHYQDIIQDIDPDYKGLLCFSETKVFNYSMYQLHDMNCIIKAGTNHHGNVIYSNLPETEDIMFQTDIIESVAVKASNLIVISVYVPPGHGLRVLKDLENLIEQASQTSVKRTIVIGDFNLSIDHVNRATTLLDRYGYSQLVSEPTHQLGSILDLAFSNVKDVTVKNVPVWFSDHHAVILHVKN